ncbi:AraC family transcriptional regulator [Longispora fulva]|uniref:AraC-like DNA-binding protein n=1 Tax=Longispora fulva TaxID=619741 RepID=A0A8J7GGF4_9ACTN|nr:AraC family transcriptional regulator [Longispora fulva]MBG6133934.1 AraC-like DNA-binding protein [Longispora fulva]
MELRLHRPPTVVNAGAAIHGTGTLQDTFLLPDLWQVHLYAYSGALTVAGVTHPIRPGHVSLVPPGEEVRFRYEGRSEHLYAHLRLPTAGEAQRVPVMQDAARSAEPLAGMLRSAIAALPRHPDRAAAELWAALWRIAQLQQSGLEGRHLAVLRATEFIEARLNEPITVPQVAHYAEISHNQLTRLFRAETGDTVVGYLRQRRLARAEHLLRHTTMPIPAIAAAVGIPDLQAFNKACRRQLGAAPRTVRTGTGT